MRYRKHLQGDVVVTASQVFRDELAGSGMTEEDGPLDHEAPYE